MKRIGLYCLVFAVILYLTLTTLLAAWNLFIGFPKVALASPLVKGGVKTPTAKWLRLFVLHGPTALSDWG